MRKQMLTVLMAMTGLLFVPPAFAAQLDAAIIHDENTTKPSFKFLRIMYIEYPQGGEIAKSLVGRAQEISIIADSTSPGMSGLISHLNKNLKSTSSNVIITDAEVNYKAILSGNKDSAVIEYKMEIIPTITNHILQRQDGKSTIDASWRGIKITQPVIIDTQYGKFDINNPRSALDVLIPKTSEKISNSEIVEMPLIDASKILELPLDKWHSLFDNTAIIPGAKEFNFTGKYVITHYSMGECNLEVRDTCQDREWLEDFEIDKRYTIRAIESQDDATIAIEGYVDYSRLGDTDVFLTSLHAPVSYKPDTDEFPASVMYGMAGTAAVGAVVIFAISNRKLKRDQNEGQTGIDPAHLRAYETSDSAGGYKTNRGEAYLTPPKKSKMPISGYDIS